MLQIILKYFTAQRISAQVNILAIEVAIRALSYFILETIINIKPKGSQIVQPEEQKKLVIATCISYYLTNAFKHVLTTYNRNKTVFYV